MTKLKEALTRGAESELIQSELYGTIIDSVQAKLVGTQLVAVRFTPADIPGSSIDVPLNTKNNLAVDMIAEGAEFRKDQAAAVSFNLKPAKYGLDCQITKEMTEDAKFPMLEWNLKQAGYQMARKLDSLILAQIETASPLTDSTGATYGEVLSATRNVSGGTAVTLANISTAVKNLEANDYEPDFLIVSPAVADDIRNIDTFHEADKSGSREMFERGMIGRIMGMTVIMSSQVTANYAYVIDSKHALCLAEKRPITVERYNQANVDLVGLAVSARWGVRYLRPGACSMITSS
jgi:N4-gp56 family major capsid protein